MHLLTDRSSGPREIGEAGSIASAIIKAGIQINVGRGAAGAQFKQLVPGVNQGSKAGSDYIYFLSPSRADNVGSSGGSLTRQRAEQLLFANRYQRFLYHRVDHDLARTAIDRGFDAEMRREQFALTVVGTENNHGRIAPDRFFEEILDYWSFRSYDAENDLERFKQALEKKGFPDFKLDELDKDQVLELPLCVDKAHDSKLQELLLRHLAIISIPVEAAVLAECPRIKARLALLLNDPAPKRALILRTLKYALILAAQRGLTLVIIPRNKPSLPTPGPAAEDVRYQVHRALQLHIYRKLGAQNAEPPDAYFFSLSLYASQTRELPILNANAYAFLQELVDGLIDLPGPNNTSTIRPQNIRAQCLRAGIGVARTLFSIGVVARFADLSGVSTPRAPRPGYFEHHRFTLRWMLLEAARMDRAARLEAAQIERAARLEAARTNRGTRSPTGKSSQPSWWMPFYPDEIVWLLNECGIFSLARGQSFDAISMFEAALEAAAEIEGSGNQPIRRRILLNLGVCAINRGRATEARRLLNEVSQAKSEDLTLRLIADGFLGLLDHLGGAHDSAHRQYDSAIDGLTRLGRSRPVSMFLRNRGELHRHNGNYEDAKKDLSAAIDHARLSGSEDMAWFAIVAKVRLETVQRSEFGQAVRILETAENYADAMDIPFLKSEISFVHAQILLRQGETALASEKATQALRIATLNGLTLRSIAYRSLLADIHTERGWAEPAKRIKAHALQAAGNAGYRLLLQRHPSEARTDSEKRFANNLAPKQ